MYRCARFPFANRDKFVVCVVCVGVALSVSHRLVFVIR
jgi:hypothetical protein